MRSLNPETPKSSGQEVRALFGLASPRCVHFVMSSASELMLGEKEETYRHLCSVVHESKCCLSQGLHEA